MIKINLNRANLILQFHYDNLTIKKGSYWTIKDFLDNRITKHAGNPQLVAMYTHLKSKVIKDIHGHSILTAFPNELDTFIGTFELTYGALLNTTYKTTAAGKNITYRQDLLKIFYYGDYDKWSAYDLAKKIKINVCPYCNRSYTFTLGSDKNKGTRFEYDHFYNKADNPYLALSFYNLIPSCHICNSNFKGEKKFNISTNIHPYIEGFGDDIVFSIKPKNINFIDGKSSAFRIRFRKGSHSTWNNNKVKSAFENVTTFQLTKLYNLHKDYVDELIQKSIIYNAEYIDDLFNTYKGTLFSSKEDVKQLILGNYLNELDYSKRPLSKLTADISKELGLT